MLVGLCRFTGAGDLILCTGYVWEDAIGYSVLHDDLLASIGQGIGQSQVRLVAGKFGDDSKWPYWETKYRTFFNRLRQAGINATAFIAPGRNWHAKIALRLDKTGKPIAGIVGSSNLTGPAYREKYSNWNYEADVVLWKPTADLDTYFHGFFQDVKDPFGKMLLQFSHDVEQHGEEEWLGTLYKDVFRTDDGDLIPLPD